MDEGAEVQLQERTREANFFMTDITSKSQPVLVGMVFLRNCARYQAQFSDACATFSGSTKPQTNHVSV